MTLRKALFGVVIGLILVGCGSSRDADAVVANIGDLGHVHDIVVEDSDVFLAAHSGLFRVEGPGRAVLVGEFRHDFMSMADGPDGLIASGHPDLRFDQWRVEGKPAHLGFVASDDLGGSWTPVSLLGEVDFHSLTSRSDGGFYGADSSGGILASVDGVTWEERSANSATDLAASPTEPDEVLAVDAESGQLVLSVDGARTWTVVEDAPQLARVQWRANDIVGISNDSKLYTAASTDSQWLQIGELAEEPVAFTTSGEQWWVVMHDAAVLHSDDGARTFRFIYEPPARPGS